jgi:hypothetical protein
MPISPQIQVYVDQGLLTSERALGLDFNAQLNLSSNTIHEFIVNGLLTIDRAIGLDNDELVNLESPGTRDLIANGTLTLDRAVGLSLTENENLSSPIIRGLIVDNTLTLEQALGLNRVQRNNLEADHIRELIADGTLTLPQARDLDFDGRTNLASQPIRDLIRDEIFTVEQAIGLNEEGCMALDRPDILQLVRNGTLTFQNLMDGEIPPPPDVNDDEIPGIEPGIQPNILNDAQSTHTSSVHRTVSESATKLIHRYPNVMDPTTLNQLITTISAEINALPDGNPQNEAAKRCMVRLGSPEYAYTDASSGVNTRELIALSWRAIHDDEVRVGNLADATRQFVEGLYEIQRGYNLSPTGEDLQGEDSTICSAGTFNKLMEKLKGIHPDVDIEVISSTLATLKLPIVVKEEVNHYLAARANPSTVSELTQFTQQIAQIKEEGVEVIWDAIKDRVAMRIFDEFGSLYNDQNDPRFTGFIEAGKDVDLGELPSFQREVSQSKGYREYCSSIMKSYRLATQNQRQELDPDSSDENTNIQKP